MAKKDKLINMLQEDKADFAGLEFTRDELFAIKHSLESLVIRYGELLVPREFPSALMKISKLIKETR